MDRTTVLETMSEFNTSARKHLKHKLDKLSRNRMPEPDTSRADAKKVALRAKDNVVPGKEMRSKPKPKKRRIIIDDDSDSD